MLLTLLWVLAGQVPAPPPATLLLEPTPRTSSAWTVQLLRQAEAPRPAAWPELEQREWLFLRSGGSQENVLERLERDAEQRLILPQPQQRDAVTLVGLDLRPRLEAHPASTWEAFFEDRCAAAQRQGVLNEGELQREQLVVRRIESVKLLVRERDDASSGTALSKTGQQVELRPLMDPTVVPVGSDLAFKAYAPGGGSGLRGTALHPRTRTRIEFITNREGIGFFRMTHRGRWIVELHSLRAIDSPSADLELASASLVFDNGPLESTEQKEGQR